MAVLCDSAIEYQNKLCILGTFDTIKTHQLPVVKSQCSIALQILWTKIEEGPHTIKIKFMDEDGNPTLKTVDSAIKVSVPSISSFVTTNHILNIQQLKFTRTGNYLTVIDIDGKMEAEIQLQVLQVEQKT
ncbi:MAG: hypothetical protein SCARUB_04186 [Candidatus Scalindua rubra]|uniref:Uncharacterized protein n=1 Tax=Candidatus Scalindua rubra TaxID=1872076 RepID=A0A1E3X506_9BACT|nr:MAG: hypothetical protein SCARUB_04186 [Candidatus Scalindua rubra]